MSVCSAYKHTCLKVIKRNAIKNVHISYFCNNPFHHALFCRDQIFSHVDLFSLFRSFFDSSLCHLFMTIYFFQSFSTLVETPSQFNLLLYNEYYICESSQSTLVHRIYTKKRLDLLTMHHRIEINFECNESYCDTCAKKNLFR